MKILKNTLIISSYLLLIALFFSGGYALGRRGAESDAPVPEATAYPAWTEEKTENTAAPEYEVIIEDEVLKIYKCIGKSKSVVTSEKISERVFPPQDIAELREGVRFERLEEAQQLFENFVS